MQKVDLKSMTFAELQQFVEDLGEKKFRTTQLYQWMHQKMVKEFASMTNLSAAFRDKLEEQAALNHGKAADFRRWYEQVFDGA